MRTQLAITLLALVALPFAVSLATARADDGFDPFGQLGQQPPATKKSQRAPSEPQQGWAPPLAPFDGRPPASPAGGVALREPLPPVDEKSRAVERGDLAPVLAGDGSGLPYELWRGLDLARAEELIAKVEIPPRSPAIHQLWRRLITSNVAPPSGAAGDTRFEALRSEVLFRSGLLQDVSAALARTPNASSDPLLAILMARVDIALGRTEPGCDTAKKFATASADIPKRLRGDGILIAGYCAAVKGGAAAAGLGADLAREEGLDASPGLAALDALANGQKATLGGAKGISALDYRLIELAGGTDPKELIERASPALLAILAADKTAPPPMQLAAAEAATRVNAITPDALSALYRTLGASEPADALLSANPPTGRGDTSLRRAALFKAAELERTPLRKVRLIRAFLDDARRSGLYLSALHIAAKASDQIVAAPEIGWYAETGIEVALTSSDYRRARSWANFGAALDRPGDGGLRHWLALIDLADPSLGPSRDQSLGSVEDLAIRGRLNPDLLHRLATVLDALDTNVPIPLWEAASRAPQPNSGYLPDTGVLSDLLDASKKKEFGRTVLLAMRALGPNGAEGAHMIALGDSIRALKRAGLDADARRLGFEALFAQWPRSVSN